MTIRISKPNKLLTLQEGVETTKRACPDCGYEMDRAAAVAEPGEAPILPKNGSLSLCMQCGGLSVFNTDLTLRAITAEEIANLDAETRSVIAVTRWALEQAHKRAKK